MNVFFLKKEQESEQVLTAVLFGHSCVVNLIGNFAQFIDFIFSVSKIDIRCNSGISELV